VKILIFIEVDVVVRHFLHNDTFDDLAARHDVRFIFPEAGQKRMGTIDPAQLNLPGKWERLATDPRRQHLWKWLYLIDQLAWRSGKQPAARRRLHRFTLGAKGYLILRFLALPGIRQLFVQRTFRQLRKTPAADMDALLAREAPDLIIHPCVLEGLFINDLVEASRTHEVPLVVIMNSWDNPSTKQAMVGKPDLLLVWGEQTRRHAVEFAGMPAPRVLKFGSAQFDLFNGPARIIRTEFLTRNNLPADRPVIMYAGSSKGTREIEHLRILDDAIERGDIPKASILYRPHPWGGGGEGGERLLNEKWSHVAIEEAMLDYLRGVAAGNSGKYLSDYRDTHDTLTHIDALISPLSTILIEAAMHGKPTLCFVPREDGAEHLDADAAHAHFREIFELPEFLKAFSVDELADSTAKLVGLVGDSGWAARSRDQSAFFVESHTAPYRQRLRELAETIHLNGIDAIGEEETK
jgi:hypothetical protein